MINVELKVHRHILMMEYIVFAQAAQAAMLIIQKVKDME